MAKLAIKKGATDVTLNLFIQDSSETTGAGLTGLTFETASLACYYVRPGAAAAEISLVTQTVTGAHSDGGFVEIDSTNMPGWYRLDIPDAVVASGVDHAGITLQGASDMAPCNIELQLDDYDLSDIDMLLDTIDGKIDTIDGNVDAVLADTNELQTDDIPGTLSTIEGKVDTVDGNVDAILVDTGTDIPASLTTIDDEIAVIDGVVDSILEDTGTTLDDKIDTIDTNVDDIETILGTPANFKADVSLLALEATLTEIQGAGWTDETLKALADAIDAISVSGASAAEVWGYITRTLTNQGASVESPAVGDPLEIYRDTTVIISFTGLGDVTDATNIWFTAKEDLDDPDTESTIQIDTETGLLYIDGVKQTSAAEGSMVFTDEITGACKLTIVEEAAADLPLYSAYPIDWDIKMLKSGVVSILSHGVIYIHGTPTRSIT